MGALGRVAPLVMPSAILEGDGEDVGERMIERLAAGAGIIFLRIVGAAADDRVSVVAGADDDFGDGLEIDSPAQIEREIDEGLRLVFGRMRLRLGLVDRARLALRWR